MTDTTRRYNHILFDFDGTIADTIDDLIEAKVEALRVMGVTEVDTDLLSSFLGMNLRDSIVLSTNIQNEMIVREAMDIYNDILTKRAISRLHLYDHVGEMLERLKKDGIGIGIFSLRRDRDIDAVIRHHGLDGLVEAWIGEDAVENPKPAPDMIYELLERMHAEPEETIVVGDTIYDIEMGQLTGSFTVAFTGGAQPAKLLRRCKPDLIVDKFDDFPACFDRRTA